MGFSPKFKPCKLSKQKSKHWFQSGWFAVRRALYSLPRRGYFLQCILGEKVEPNVLPPSPSHCMPWCPLKWSCKTLFLTHQVALSEGETALPFISVTKVSHVHNVFWTLRGMVQCYRPWAQAGILNPIKLECSYRLAFWVVFLQEWSIRLDTNALML